jgi:hypothetical protein
MDAHPMTISVDFKAIGLAESVEARDLWQGKDLGMLNGSVTQAVPRHAAVLLRVRPVGAAEKGKGR